MPTRGSVGDMAPSAKIPKVATSRLMTRLEARHRQLEIQRRLTRTKQSIQMLQQMLTSARTTEAEDELALTSVDARLSLEME